MLNNNKTLCCPTCKGELVNIQNDYQCTNVICKSIYPVLNGIPILIDENRSIFKIESFINNEDTTFINEDDTKPILKNIINKLVPSINANYVSGKILNKFSRLINKNGKISILIIGGSVDGIGMKEFIISNDNNELIISDVSFGGDINIICDCHSLPFKDNVIDAVIIQAVLEHVLDPYQCVNEISRVLKIGGYVLSEIPFMQQLHQAPYDFTRFTYLGHRWLFKEYEHIDSGVVCGSGMGLTWSIRGFVCSLFKDEYLQAIFTKIASLLFFWLKYFDFRHEPELRKGFESASSIYFIGKLNSAPINFNQLLEYYNEKK